MIAANASVAVAAGTMFGRSVGVAVGRLEVGGQRSVAGFSIGRSGSGQQLEARLGRLAGNPLYYHGDGP